MVRVRPGSLNGRCTSEPRSNSKSVSAGTTVMPDALLDHAHHGGEVLHLQHGGHPLRVERGLEVLANAARAREVHEGVGGEVLHAQRRPSARAGGRAGTRGGSGRGRAPRSPTRGCPVAVAARAKSARPARTSSRHWSESVSCRARSTPGWARRNSAKMPGSHPAASDGSAATDTRPLRRATRSPMSDSQPLEVRDAGAAPAPPGGGPRR